MAVPKYKPSKSRTRRRKAVNMKLDPVNVIPCPNCGNMVLPHRVCSKCGFYRDKQVFEPEDMA